jgi:hypothetical protein
MIRVSWIVQGWTAILRTLSKRFDLGNLPCDLFAVCVENRTADVGHQIWATSMPSMRHQSVEGDESPQPKLMQAAGTGRRD